MSKKTVVEIPISEAFPDEKGEEDALSEITPQINCLTYILSHQRTYRWMPDLFRDDKRLPERTRDRYKAKFITYRYDSDITYKTQKDLDDEREARTPKVTVEIKGPLKWTQEEALQYLEEKAEAEAKVKKKKTKTAPRKKTIEEIHYADIKTPKIKLKTREIDELLACRDSKELQNRFKKLQAKYDTDEMMAEEVEEYYEIKRWQGKEK